MSQDPFQEQYRVLWGDVDANQHMRNTAYLDYAVETRHHYFKVKGFGEDVFSANHLGLVALTDQIAYHREINFQDKFIVQFLCAGINEKRSRQWFVNRFMSLEGDMLAEVRSHVVWFDLQERCSRPAPEGIVRALEGLARTDDFAWL